MSRKRLGKEIGNIGRLEDGSKRRQECHGEVIIEIVGIFKRME